MPGFELKSIVACQSEVYGVRKVWKQLNREGGGCCTVQRLMRETGRGRGSGSPV